MTTEVVAVAEHMNPEAKLLWLNALRSGEFDQTHGLLASVDENDQADGFCCLGVLCEVAAREGVIPAGQPGNIYDEVPTDETYRDRDGTRMVYGDLTKPRVGISRSSTELPDKVREWAGLEKSIPTVWSPRDQEDIDFDIETGIENPEEFVRHGLAELNDGGMTFTDIADLIERDL